MTVSFYNLKGCDAMAMTKERRLYYARRLKLYLEAEEKILSGQSYRIGTRTVTRADLAAVQKKIGEIENILNNAGVGSKAVRVVPRDL